MSRREERGRVKLLSIRLFLNISYYATNYHFMFGHPEGMYTTVSHLIMPNPVVVQYVLACRRAGGAEGVAASEAL